jgi:hypothetical protein
MELGANVYRTRSCSAARRRDDEDRVSLRGEVVGDGEYRVRLPHAGPVGQEEALALLHLLDGLGHREVLVLSEDLPVLRGD